MTSCAASIDAFSVARPTVQTVPVVLTSPHSGQNYQADFLASSRLDRLAIRRSEDSFVDELFSAAPLFGMPLLAAHFPRAYCDANREAWELDPSMFTDPLPAHVNTSSTRVLAGLGTIAKVVSSNEAIYRGKLNFAEAEARIAACWQPFHAILQELIAETVARFGVCLLVDCHSMPGMPVRAGQRAQIILGDSHGASCAGAVTSFTQSYFRQYGWEVRCNDPYAGGYITRHYGKPALNQHALQVEIARSLYMNERNFSKTSDFLKVRGIIGQFLEALSRSAGTLLGMGTALPLAAE